MFIDSKNINWKRTGIRDNASTEAEMRLMEELFGDADVRERDIHTTTDDHSEIDDQFNDRETK